MNIYRDINGRFDKKYNKYDLSGEYGVGWTNKGEEFWFDKEDYDKIKNYCWHYNRSGHLISTEPNSNKRAFLHRKVMEPVPDGMMVDHINHPSRNQPKYDNRKQNLRFVTSRQNTINSTIRSDNTSGVTGVSYNKRTQKWIVRINIAPNKRVVIGSYNNFEDAVNARKEAETQYYGDYSYNVNNKGGN